MQRIGSKPHYAFVVAGVTFLALLVAAALRAAPGVLMIPLEQSLGWSRGSISFAAASGLFLYGLVGPFAAGLMQAVGIRIVLFSGLAIMFGATFLSLFMTESWEYTLTWGIFSGLGSGAVTSVLAAAVVNRWFVARKGLVLGFLTASTATGSLIFLPLMAWLASAYSWRAVVIFIAFGCAALLPVVAVLFPESPQIIGLSRFGATEAENVAPSVISGSAVLAAMDGLRKVRASGMFWILFGTFFICGLTTNGLVGAHMIAFCGDHGVSQIQAAGLLSLMGLFDLVGTTVSGWLTDRYDPRWLLAAYYGLRGMSLLALPFLDFHSIGLTIFAIFYGLDWIATVPPTVTLITRSFGERDSPVLYGWIMVGHQLGAAFAAFAAGWVRDAMDTYTPAFTIAGMSGLLAAGVILCRRRYSAGVIPT